MRGVCCILPGSIIPEYRMRGVCCILPGPIIPEYRMRGVCCILHGPIIPEYKIRGVCCILPGHIIPKYRIRALCCILPGPIIIPEYKIRGVCCPVRIQQNTAYGVYAVFYLDLLSQNTGYKGCKLYSVPGTIIPETEYKMKMRGVCCPRVPS